MIRATKHVDEAEITSILEGDIFQNPYLYIDAQIYGLKKGTDIETWVLEDEKRKIAILYRYYNSLQLFGINDFKSEDVRLIVNHINDNGYEMISGSLDYIQKIHSLLSNKYNMSSGWIMVGEDYSSRFSGENTWASIADCGEIAELICSDKEIGGHYTVELLSKQLEDRMINYQCKNLIKIKQGQIVSHVATYAEHNKLAVLGGLVTRPEARGLGYGRSVLSDLAICIKQEGKIPVLFCYDEKIIDWYKSLGWKEVYACAKLERRR